MLDVLVLVHLGLVERLVKVGRIVVLVGDSDTDELDKNGANSYYSESQQLATNYSPAGISIMLPLSPS